MARITRRQALACGALTVPLLTGSTVDKDQTTAIGQVVDAAIKFWQVPGVALGIVRDGKVTYLAGHGVKKLGSTDPVTPNTLFAIASCTKAFTTTAMAMLVGAGRMAWDDPVRNYLEYFRLADPSA